MAAVRILIVEDEFIVASDIRAMLEKLGYSVCGITGSGDDAIELAKKESPDIILMDIVLESSVDGVEAADYIRNELHIPVIFVTAHGDDAIIERARATEPFGYLIKPFNESDLRCTIEMALYKAEAEARLRENERRHRAIIEEAQAGYFFIDPQGIIWEVNDSWLAIHGYERREDVVGRHFFEMHPGEDHARIRRTMTHLLRGDSIPTVECRHLRGDGTVGHHSCSAHTVYRGKEIIGAEGFIIDTTRQKLLEQRVERERSLLSAILDTVGALVVVLDRKGRIIRFNKECERATGYGFKEVRNVPIWDILLAPEKAQGVKNAFQAACEGGALRQNFQDHLMTRDGSRRLIDWSNTALRDETGMVEYVIGTGIDITERQAMQKALRVSEERFSRVFKASPMSITITTMEGGVYLEVNEAFTRATGYKREEVIGRSSIDIGIWSSPREREQAVRAIRENGRLWEFELPYRTRSGEVRIALWSAERVELDGRACLISVFSDVTERKRSEEALRLSEEKWSKTFRTSPVWASVATLDEGMFLEVNDAFTKTTGFSREEALGRTILELKLYPNPADRTRLLKIARERGGFRDQEISYRMKNGEIRSFLWSAEVIELDGKACTINAAMDITERKKAENSLRESEERYRALVESSSDAIFSANMDRIIVSCNQAFLDVFGYERNEVVGQSTRFLYPDDESFRCKGEVGLLNMLEGGSHMSEVEFVTRDGTIIPTETHVSALKDSEGNMTGHMGVIRDISERKKAEEEKLRLEAQLQQAQKMEAIGTLAGGIAHDFNNILSAIIGYTELGLLDMPEGARARSKLEQVLKAGLRAKDLINQILAFSRRSEQGRISLRMSSLIMEALKLIRASLPTSIEIRPLISASTGCVEANPTQIHQVLLNLCGNAAHAMRERGGVLEVSLSEVELAMGAAELQPDMVPGHYFKLSVSDTGHGMTPDIMARVFEPYFTTKKLGEGTGLGLSVVHGIVRGLGGAVTAASTPGKGSTFDVYLPAAIMKQEVECETAEPFLVGTERILLVDDEEELVNIGRAMLEHLGYTVVGITGSIEARTLFLAEPDRFDLVITDQTMPGMLGSDLALEILKVRPNMPIILCTGYNEMMDGDKARAMGIREFAMKPLEMKTLAGIVRRVLDSK